MWKVKWRVLIKRHTGGNKRCAKQYLNRYCKLEKAKDLSHRNKVGSDCDETILRVIRQAGLPAVLKWYPVRCNHQPCASLCCRQGAELAESSL